MKKVLFLVGLLLMPLAVEASMFAASPGGTVGCQAYSRAEARVQLWEKRGAVVLCQDVNGEVVGFVFRRNGEPRCVIRGQLSSCGGCGWLDWCGEMMEFPCQ